MNTKAVSVYLIQTELQCISYMAVDDLASSNNSLVFTRSEKIYQFLKKNNKPVYHLKKNYLSSFGWLGLIFFLRKSLGCIKKVIKQQYGTPEKIIFLAARIDTLLSNVCPGYLRYHFPSSELDVRLIADGTINVINTDNSSLEKKLIKHARKLKLFADMKVTHYQGDLLGVDADVVSCIYLFKGTPADYPANKIKYIDFPVLSKKSSTGQKRALVIGQKIRKDERMDGFSARVLEKVVEIIRREGIEQVDYLAHPRSSQKEFLSESFESIAPPFCAEYLLASKAYTHVFSCSSSVLLNARIICFNSIQIYSVGLNAFFLLKKAERQKLASHYTQLGIEVVDI